MPDFWSPNSRRVAAALLAHHRAVCVQVADDTPLTDAVISRCTLTYEELRRSACIGGIAQDMGRHLRKIAVWCEFRGFPPLHALVVRDSERNPGDGYMRCPGTSGDWRSDARDCIVFRGYPKSLA